MKGDARSLDLDSTNAGTIADTLAFDYAPSFSFHMDNLQFDFLLLGAMRATRFRPKLVALAEATRTHLFGHNPYLAAHLRRDGYQNFCFGVRFGV